MVVSHGDASTVLKSGVLIRWQTNNNNYDDFVLLRKEKNSSEAADTLIVTTENNYLDRSAVPDRHYDYTVVARYSCNGKYTTNSASAEGWRTPYGEISGTIQMPDNTGMAGITVSLTDSADHLIKEVKTDASGAYKFDSLEYITCAYEKAKVRIRFLLEDGSWPENIRDLIATVMYWKIGPPKAMVHMNTHWEPKYRLDQDTSLSFRLKSQLSKSRVTAP